MFKKDCVAMILAGGQGSRLSLMTKKLAKPAVAFGGKYRIIDFVLSNCANSDIDTVGVLTQYKPLILNSYIGVGSAWNLDSKFGGVYTLPPYQTEDGGEWYKGTAHAIYQNIDFIDTYNPEHVLILSGDHLYKMDYDKMLQHHKDKGADVTISVMEVPWDEASRFGIMNTDSTGRIIEFEEKPKEPKNNLASMGVYIFNWQLLRSYLIQDERDEFSSHDFGKNIIPKMLSAGKQMFSYRFKGYWRDIGTVESYHEASLDLLKDEPELDLYDTSWKIFSVNPNLPTSYFAEGSKVTDSMVNDGAQVFGTVENSIISAGVIIGKGSVVRNSIIMPGTVIGANVTVDKTIICESAFIKDNSVVGYLEDETVALNDAAYPITIIGEALNIDQETVIKAGSRIGSEVEINPKISRKLKECVS
jgi:glucose-1-phosphate adenylyltransferase